MPTSRSMRWDWPPPLKNDGNSSRTSSGRSVTGNPWSRGNPLPPDWDIRRHCAGRDENHARHGFVGVPAWNASSCACRTLPHESAASWPPILLLILMMRTGLGAHLRSFTLRKKLGNREEPKVLCHFTHLFWTAVGSTVRHRFVRVLDNRTICCVRKRSRRCALPAQSMTRI